ncbi:MAG: hypothetical protein R3D26_12115 [Cyanobacteriota/Melainabacteria group bacterium]
MTGDEVARSADVFPVKFMHIKNYHLVLFGDDLADFNISLSIFAYGWSKSFATSVSGSEIAISICIKIKPFRSVWCLI